MALAVFQMTDLLEGWRVMISPVSGKILKLGLDIIVAQSVSNALGIPWSEELLERLAICSEVILRQEAQSGG